MIHAGDFSWRGTLEEVIPFLDWFAKQPAKHKILTVGNHEGGFVWHQHDLFKEECKLRDLIFLNDSGIEIDGLKFWGSGWTPTFCNWYWMADRGVQIRQHWNMIPEDTNVLVSHGPPMGILDKLIDGTDVGCQDLMDRILKTPGLKACFFGHIHLHGGRMQEFHGIKFFNCSVCTEEYKPWNPITEVEL